MAELFLGDSVLPQLLSSKETYELLSLVAKGSKSAVEKLITHNIRLVIYEVTHSFDNVEYEKQDLVSIGNIGLIKAVNSYDLSRGASFSTYAKKCIHNEILLFLRKNKKEIPYDSLDRLVLDNGSDLTLKDVISDNDDFTLKIDNYEICKIINSMVKDLPDRDRHIIMLYFGFYKDRLFSQQEIADMMHMSKANVSKIIHRNVEQIREELEKKGLVELNKKNPIRFKEKKLVNGHFKTIYELFSNYSREDVDELITKLTVEEYALLRLRYGDDLDNPTWTYLKPTDSYKFYGVLIPRMRNLLEAKSKKLNNILLLQSFISNEELILVLKFGIFDGKIYETEDISKLIGIDEKEVIEILNQLLVTHREDINLLLADLTSHINKLKKEQVLTR